MRTNVLLVEDNPADAALVTELLREHAGGEFALDRCASLREAHSYLATGSTDCVLLDLSLPDAQGLEGLEDMQKHHRALPLVVLTGNTDDELSVRAVRRGAQDFLSKQTAGGHDIAQAIRYAVVRKRAEREIEEEKDRFFAAVSHDLRTPLTNVIGYLEEVLAESVGPLTPESRSFLGIAAVNAERLLRLVNDVLFMARVRAGSLELRRSTVDVRELAEAAVALARPFAVAKGISLAAEGTPSRAIQADPLRLSQVLDNLITNAIRYTPPGGDVRVLAASDDERVTLAVSDTGAGIAPEDRAHVFEFFFRAPAAREAAVTGVGLGLSVVKTIVDAHGGSVAVESTPGAGSCFTVLLPFVPAAGAGASS